MSDDITADQIRRLQNRRRGGRSIYADSCVICGEAYKYCPHNAWQVGDLVRRIDTLTADQRNTILQGEAMPKTTTEKADELVAKANELLKAAEELKAQAAREEVTRYRYPKEPSPGMNKFTIAVKFRGDGQWYQFLILRVPGKGYFTTGRQKNAWFATWENFIDWLRSDDVTQCGKLCSLNLGVMEMTVP